MKNMVKFFGIIAIVVVIVFTMATCSTDDEPGEQALQAGVWKEGTLTAENDEYPNFVWETFSVTSGTTYWYWLKTASSPSASGETGWAVAQAQSRYDGKSGTIIHSSSAAGNGAPATGTRSFKAEKNGIVYIGISPFNHVYGKFKVAFSTTETRPSGE
ncbi:MAG: hypothetical protein LBH43_01970 [Treponema sp.]|jgi:hypothetical protein|nr:hypothetical protein [Treponema sp.]